MLSDIFPTGFECGVLNGKIQPGCTVAIIGAGPIGLATLLTAQFYSPAEIIMVDVDDDNRLEVAKRLGATTLINSKDGKAVEKIMKFTNGRGVDTSIEAVGIPATFELCTEIVAPDGIVANAGVRESRSALGKTMGPQYHHYHTPRRHSNYVAADENGAVENAEPERVDHASLQARSDSRCL